MAKKKAMQKRRGRSDTQANPSTTLIAYRGPIRQLDAGVPRDEIVVTISTVSTQNGNASLGAQGNTGTAGFTGSADWTRFALLYDEYRVLGFNAVWKPFFGKSTSTVTQASGLWITTHDPTTLAPFTSLGVMVNYADWSEWHTGKPSTKEWKMASTEESQFTPTGSPTNQGYIAWFAPTALSTGAYGNFYFTFRIQLRGRK